MKTQTLQAHKQIALRVTHLIFERRGVVSVEAMTGHVGVSETLCRQSFLELTGEGIEDFCRRVRLEQAAELLSKGDDAIWQIALETGYLTIPGFDHAFRSHFNCTPSAFRSLNPDGVTFPSYASCQGFEPGRARVEIGVYTGLSQVTTFTYDPFGLIERQTPDGVRHAHGSSRRGNAICDAILGRKEEIK